MKRVLSLILCFMTAAAPTAAAPTYITGETVVRTDDQGNIWVAVDEFSVDYELDGIADHVFLYRPQGEPDPIWVEMPHARLQVSHDLGALAVVGAVDGQSFRFSLSDAESASPAADTLSLIGGRSLAWYAGFEERSRLALEEPATSLSPTPGASWQTLPALAPFGIREVGPEAVWGGAIQPTGFEKTDCPAGGDGLPPTGGGDGAKSCSVGCILTDCSVACRPGYVACCYCAFGIVGICQCVEPL